MDFKKLPVGERDTRPQIERNSEEREQKHVSFIELVLFSGRHGDFPRDIERNIDNKQNLLKPIHIIEFTFLDFLSLLHRPRRGHRGIVLR